MDNVILELCDSCDYFASPFTRVKKQINLIVTFKKEIVSCEYRYYSIGQQGLLRNVHYVATIVVRKQITFESAVIRSKRSSCSKRIPAGKIVIISDVCEEEFEKSDIITWINSDYSAITLHFSSIAKQKYRPSFWKFNSSLAGDTNFVALSTESVPEWLNEFHAVT